MALAPALPAPAVHHGVQCDGCRAVPITGTRHRCNLCKDYDLCRACYDRQQQRWQQQEQQRQEQEQQEQRQRAQSARNFDSGNDSTVNSSSNSNNYSNAASIAAITSSGRHHPSHAMRALTGPPAPLTAAEQAGPRRVLEAVSGATRQRRLSTPLPLSVEQQQRCKVMSSVRVPTEAQPRRRQTGMPGWRQRKLLELAQL
jgi:hypothetical protein